MFVRIQFYGVVKTESGKQSGFRDYVDVHVGSMADAKKLWRMWMNKNAGIRGDSGYFHPLFPFGEITEEKFSLVPTDKDEKE